MSSRKKLIKKIATTEKNLYHQQAKLSAHKRHLRQFYKQHQVIILAVAIPAVFLIWRANTTKRGIDVVKQFGHVLILSVLASARSKIIQTVKAAI